MKTAIMYGAGNIGRGFIGKVFADSGYEVCFLDIMQEIIDEMNARGEYTVRIVSNDGEKDTTVKPVRAVNSLTDQAIDEIVNCEIMATAVGVNVLPRIAPVIAKGMVARMERTGRPLDVILCDLNYDSEWDVLYTYHFGHGDGTQAKVGWFDLAARTGVLSPFGTAGDYLALNEEDGAYILYRCERAVDENGGFALTFTDRLGEVIEQNGGLFLLLH